MKFHLKIFLFFLIFLFNYIKSKNFLQLSSLNCSIFNSCDECNLNNKCIFSNNLCIEDNNNLNWINKIQTCEINKIECGEIIIKSNKIDIDFTNLLNSNKKKVFCSWDLSRLKLKEKRVIFRIKNNEKFIKIELLVNKTYYEIETNKLFSKSFKKENKYMLFYFNSELLEKNSLTIDIKIKNIIELNDILYIILFLFIIIAVFSTIIIIIFIFKKNRRNNFVSSIHLDKIETQEKILADLMKKLNSVYYTKDLEIYNKKCTICLENFYENHKIILLNCLHGFHINCLLNWVKQDIKKNKNCPVCNNGFFEKIKIKFISTETKPFSSYSKDNNNNNNDSDKKENNNQNNIFNFIDNE